MAGLIGSVDGDIIDGGIIDGIINGSGGIGGGFTGGGGGFGNSSSYDDRFVRDFTALLEPREEAASGLARHGGHMTPGDGAVLTYKFATDWSQFTFPPTEPGARQTYQPLTPAERDMANAGLARLESISDVVFVEVPVDETADLVFGGTFDIGDRIAGYAYMPIERQAVSEIWLNNDLTPEFMFEVILHELGHTMGLKHPFEDDPLLHPDLDNTTITIMSYTGEPGVSNYGPLDVDALEHIYGPRSGDFNAGYSAEAGRVEITLNDPGGVAFFAGHGDSYVRGSAGNDVIEIGLGSDVVIGGAGTDVVALTQSPDLYDVTVDNGLYTVTPRLFWESDEVDILLGVEMLQFSWDNSPGDGRPMRSIDEFAVDVSVTDPVFRFFNSKTGTYFYSSDPAERNTAIEMISELLYEGVKYRHASADDPDAMAMYRFYNTASKTHFYTISEDEVALVKETMPGLSFEGVAYHVLAEERVGTVPLHRFFDNDRGAHVYTADQAEAMMLQSEGPTYSYEGTSGWVFL